MNVLVSNFSNSDLNLNLKVFKTQDDSIFFPATDFARKMGYRNPQWAIRRHVDPEDKIRLGDLQGARCAHLVNNHPHTQLLTESGGYSLMFGSELPLARDFRRWLSKDVIPSIRQTGAYHLPGALPKFEAITDLDFEQILTDEQQTKEMRNKMDTRRDQIKDRKMSELGKIGGGVTQQRRRDMKKKLEEQEDEIEDLKDDIDGLKEEIEILAEENEQLSNENELLSDEKTRVRDNEDRLLNRILDLEGEIDGLRKLAHDCGEILDDQTKTIKEMETKINSTPDRSEASGSETQKVELPKPNEEGL